VYTVNRLHPYIVVPSHSSNWGEASRLEARSPARRLMIFYLFCNPTKTCAEFTHQKSFSSDRLCKKRGPFSLTVVVSFFFFGDVNSSFHTSVVLHTTRPHLHTLSSRLRHGRLQLTGRHLEENGGCSQISRVKGHSCSPGER